MDILFSHNFKINYFKSAIVRIVCKNYLVTQFSNSIPSTPYKSSTMLGSAIQQFSHPTLSKLVKHLSSMFRNGHFSPFCLFNNGRS